MAINLNRDIPVELNGIKNNPNNFYRAHGYRGYQDWLDTNKIRGNPNGAYHDEAFFSKGAPLDRYTADNRSGRTHVIETNSPRMGVASNGYPVVNELTNNDFYRIHELQPDGVYKNIHTNVPQQMVRGGGMIPAALQKVSPYIPQAIKNGASAIGGFLNKVNLPMLGAQAVWNANKDQRARNENRSRMQDFYRIPKNTEIGMPR